MPSRKDKVEELESLSRMLLNFYTSKASPQLIKSVEDTAARYIAELFYIDTL